MSVNGKGDAGLCFDPEAALDHLRLADPKLGQVIERVGSFSLEVRDLQNVFEALARNIVYQQLHGRAAAAIHQRLIDLCRRRKLRPQDVLAVDDAALRAVGLSGAKLAALKDLAAKTLDGTVPTLAKLRRMSDEEIIAHLTQVRGIGRWTAEMLLMFRLGRPDVLPVGDYAVRKGYATVYGLAEMPRPKELWQLCENWRPYRSVGSWYMWRVLDLPPETLRDK